MLLDNQNPDGWDYILLEMPEGLWPGHVRNPSRPTRDSPPRARLHVRPPVPTRLLGILPTTNTQGEPHYDPL